MKHVTYTSNLSGTFNLLHHSLAFLILGSTPLKDTRQCRVSHEDSRTYSGLCFPIDSGKFLHLFRLTVLLRNRLNDRGISVRFTACLLHSVQTDSGVHQAPYIMCIEGCFPGGKAAVT